MASIGGIWFWRALGLPNSAVFSRAKASYSRPGGAEITVRVALILSPYADSLIFRLRCFGDVSSGAVTRGRALAARLPQTQDTWKILYRAYEVDPCERFDKLW